MREAELVVVGGGATGGAAALAAQDEGLQTILVDENPLDPAAIRRNVPYWFGPRAGGRITRRGDPLRWLEQRPALQQAADRGVDLRLGHAVWGLFTGLIVGLYDVDGNRTDLIKASAVILAPGATDLHLAFPGWTLGGVLGGLGALRLLETYGYLDAQRLLILGATPVATLIASRAAAAGTDVVGIVDLSATAAARWPGHTLLEARGGADVEEVALTSIEASSASDVTVRVDSVCVAIGQPPSIELAAIAGCALAFDAPSGSRVVVHDGQQRTTRPGVFVADSPAAGERAARSAAQWVRQPSAWPQQCSAPHERARANQSAYASRWHEIADKSAADDLIVCRCEEITRGEVLAALRQEPTVDPDELKRVSRAGMGLCQGRGCRPIVAGVLATQSGAAFADIPLATYRPPVRPVPMRALATEEGHPDAPREPIHAANFRLPGRSSA